MTVRDPPGDRGHERRDLAIQMPLRVHAELREHVRFGSVGKGRDVVRTAEAGKRCAQVEQRGPAADQQFPVERVGDRQCTSAIGADLHRIALDQETPRLRIVAGGREDGVAHREAQLLLDRAGGRKVRFVDPPCRQSRLSHDLLRLARKTLLAPCAVFAIIPQMYGRSFPLPKQKGGRGLAACSSKVSPAAKSGIRPFAERSAGLHRHRSPLSPRRASGLAHSGTRGLSSPASAVYSRRLPYRERQAHSNRT